MKTGGKHRPLERADINPRKWVGIAFGCGIVTLGIEVVFLEDKEDGQR